MGQQQLHIVFLPLMAHGHIIPILDMAKLFTSRGLKTTIIATPSFSHSIKRAQESGHNIGLSLIKFPPEKSSLPKDINIPTIDQMSSPHFRSRFFEATSLLQEPVEKLLHELNPSCLISDMFYPWTANSAAKFGIPRLIFHGTSCFAICVGEQMQLHKPYNKGVFSDDSDPFVVPHLPHELTFVRTQVAPYELVDDGSGFPKLFEQARESDRISYGTIFNSFHELEHAYADHYGKVSRGKAWHIGPLLLGNKYNNGGMLKEILQRGEESSIDEHECMSWLDSKRPNSVVYVCFGSLVTFSQVQLHDTAAGLEASGQDFIWVVRQGGNHEESFLPDDQGFGERIKGKGMIIRGWAPQVMILDHPSTGAFVTHCGWNSTLEGICAGVPMVTWPVFADQFYNEKLVTEVLGIGVSVESKKWGPVESEGVGREAVEMAVRGVMVGKEAEEMRRRAKEYKEMARKAIEEGGSSYSGVNDLIDELSNYVAP